MAPDEQLADWLDLLRDGVCLRASSSLGIVTILTKNLSAKLAYLGA